MVVYYKISRRIDPSGGRRSHSAAHALGFSVTGIRFLAIITGGALAGIGGSYLTLVQTPLFVEGMTAGRGWIALALVVFASWRRYRYLLGPSVW